MLVRNAGHCLCLHQPNSLTMKAFVAPIFLALLFISSNSLMSQDTEGTLEWTAEKTMEFLSVGSSVVSPDESLVAFTVREPVMTEDKSEYLTHIHLAKVDGSGSRQFTRGKSSSSSPQFSPDGKYLSFVSKRDAEKGQVWAIPLDGGEAIQLSDAKNGVSNYSWAPSGLKIAYTMTDVDSEDEEKAKKEKSQVIRVNENFKMSHLYVAEVSDLEITNTTQVTSGDYHVTSFDWSPDGSQIAFSHAINPDIEILLGDQDISSVPSDSGAVELLVTGPGVDSNPHFSRDGSKIAFTSQGGADGRVGLADVYTKDLSSGLTLKLAETPNRSASIVDWAPDDSGVIAQDSWRMNRQLYHLDFSLQESETPSKDAKTLAHGMLGSVVMSPSGNFYAFSMQNPNSPQEMFVQHFDDEGSTQKISKINEGVEIPEMGRTEGLVWKSSDGLEIEGLLTYPVGYQEGQKVPLILNVHGGPAGMFSTSFTGAPPIYMVQVFAQNGYAVLRPNPRGSTGYGKEFRYANVKDWGYGDYEDLMSGVDHVIKMGVGDPDQLYLMGWSYGGYMTSFAVTRTDRFNAASMGAGLPNLISMVTTTDIGNYLTAHMDGEYFDDYETYEKHSAIYQIKNVVTPTQVIHGAEDLRVPLDQGREFYNSLRRLGVDTEMIILPRTPHGPREPRLLMTVTPMIMDWFEKYK